jgi:hypothetical protein
VPVLADISVLPTNNTHDLAWSSSASFRIQGSSPLSGHDLAPLTNYLVNLSSSQAQVRLSQISESLVSSLLASLYLLLNPLTQPAC